MNRIPVIIFLALLMTSCGEEVNDDWLIPFNEVFDGGPGKDGIPSVDEPLFIGESEAVYLEDNDLIVGFKSGEDVRAYPHSILDWHEIINDEVGNTKVSIVYCPLTGTATAWNRVINGEETTFGVSGLLYNSNIIPYDRKTNSNWSQIRLDCVNGALSGQQIETFQVVETTWKTWREMYPNSEVISTNTGFSRNYESYPYGDYRTNNDRIIFPVSDQDTRLPAKERAHGVIVNGKAKGYSINEFGSNLTLIEDLVNGVPIIVVGHTDQNFVVSFYQTLEDGTSLDFSPIENSLPAILVDNEGNTWDVFGYAIDGPRIGQRLTLTESFMGYWFAWGAFYPKMELY